MVYTKWYEKKSIRISIYEVIDTKKYMNSCMRNCIQKYTNWYIPKYIIPCNDVNVYRKWYEKETIQVGVYEMIDTKKYTNLCMQNCTENTQSSTLRTKEYQQIHVYHVTH